jgi:hypothetical protein
MQWKLNSQDGASRSTTRNVLDVASLLQEVFSNEVVCPSYTSMYLADRVPSYKALLPEGFGCCESSSDTVSTTLMQVLQLVANHEDTPVEGLGE